MKPIEERIAACLTFLEGIRPGYKYTISIFKPKLLGDTPGWRTTASVVGESYQDKSYPHVFLTVSLTEFDKLPEAIQAESEKIIREDIDMAQRGWRGFSQPSVPEGSHCGTTGYVET